MESNPKSLLPEINNLDLSEAVVVPYHPDDPKFSKITAQLEAPNQIMQLYLLKKPTTVECNGPKVEPNDHMEHKEIDESEQPELPPPQGVVVAEGFDGSRIAVALWFDDYFRLASTELWDNPKFAAVADPECIPMDVKLKNAAPYNIFFNSLKFSSRTHKELNSIKFTDLLCPSLGRLKATLHVTYMVKIWWLLSNYAEMKLHKLPMTILHGYWEFAWPKSETMFELFPNIDHHYIEIYKNGPLGHHHSKLSIYMYDDDSLRVVAGTANLFGADWELYNNQLWVSPKCPKLPPGSCQTDGESPTGFKTTLLKYLNNYKDDNQKIPTLQGWIDAVAGTDFSEVKVMLLYNTPGEHYPRSNGCMLHYIGEMLTQHCTIAGPKVEHNSWRIVAQTSSIGLVGETREQWLTTQFLRTLASNTESPYYPTIRTPTPVKFSLVYPTINNCLQGYLGHRSAICGKYERGLRQLQYWLLSSMCRWKADGTNRTKAMPHSKCYFRLSPCWQKMAFYFMTSANLSRSGWGKPPNRNGTVYVRSYEIGLLFLPKFFGEDYFETTKVFVNRKNLRPFPLTVDLPLTPYTSEDEPYCWEDMLIHLGMPIEAPQEPYVMRKPRVRGRFGCLTKKTNAAYKLSKPVPISRRGRVPIPYRPAPRGRPMRGGQRGAISRSTSLGSLAWDVTRTNSRGNFVNEMLYRSGSNSSLPSETLYRSESKESLRSASPVTAGSSRGRGRGAIPGGSWQRGTNRGGNRARSGRRGRGWSQGRDTPPIVESSKEGDFSSAARYISTSRETPKFEPKSTTNIFFPKF